MTACVRRYGPLTDRHPWRALPAAYALPAEGRAAPRSGPPRLCLYGRDRQPRRPDPRRKVRHEAIAAGHLMPRIDRVFPLDRIVDAHRHLESDTAFGKIVLRP
ncbi:zinc-binding dehydrogenase [Paracoccus sediminilitoris]|uniref:zinc-binding dehydrogenase n=1 Tax=Paracoccus sediminilitoris TaxID=2202419 RepID=UPI000DB91B24|nr:zinc-binding dehydrogenase [Paracoccus sediminilitoris]